MKREINISVILSVYNGANYLKEAVDSILSQTFQAFELIIINDGSTDCSEEIIRQYEDPRIVYIRNDGNQGLIYSLNKGLDTAQGKYIARMDADDIALPSRLQVQYDFMESHPEAGICGSWFRTFDAENNQYPIVKFPVQDIDIRALMFGQSPFCHPTVMIRKEVLDEHELRYHTDFCGAEDYRLWIELLDYTQGVNISQVLLNYRHHSASVTALTDKNMESKIALISKIHYLYMQKQGVNISREECRVFTHFMDRPFFFDFGPEAQGVKLRDILLKILSQISREKKLNGKVEKNISKTLVYRGIKQKMVLYCMQSSFYRKLFIKGLIAYMSEK